MAKIVWDANGERWYENGVDHGVLWVQRANGSYKPGVCWNGLTSVDENPEGAEANDLWADNMKYGSMRSAETYGLTIHAYQSPPEFQECDGYRNPVPGLKLGQQKRTAFAFGWRSQIANDTQTESDDGYLLHVAYNLIAAPSSRTWETINDSPDAAEREWECDGLPVNLEGYKPIYKLEIDSRYVDPDKLKIIEGILYGTNETDSRLLLPDEFIQIIGGTSGVDVYLKVTPTGIENPAKANWYEMENETYTLTTDTEVDTAKTYYEKR